MNFFRWHIFFFFLLLFRQTSLFDRFTMFNDSNINRTRSVRSPSCQVWTLGEPVERVSTRRPEDRPRFLENQTLAPFGTRETGVLIKSRLTIAPRPDNML